MSKYPQLIDNNRKTLLSTLKEITPKYKKLSIATGYWDLPGTLELIDEIKNYEEVRLLIGKEPLPHHYQVKYSLDLDNPENIFPDSDFKKDLEFEGKAKEINRLRETVIKLVEMIKDNKLKVKVFRKPRLHAKAYIYGDLGDGDSVAIVGSSNFTRAGLTSNSELNFLTEDYKIIEFEPKTLNQENGHLTWFNNLWESNEAEDWSLDFSNILQKSPVGNDTYGAYDVYIKTLMEIFPNELIEIDEFDNKTNDILHEFQKENAMNLRRKLENMGMAMLADSVGLGKTITASAIIKKYLDEGKDNILILPPASLKETWINELQSSRWELKKDRDFKIISQQDIKRIENIIDENTKEIDLFVIDEAHNLRNPSSRRYEALLELIQNNPSSKVLLLTATPINNSLLDIAYQIQLGLKGNLNSVKVPFQFKNSNSIEYIDFFEALSLIQKESKRAKKKNKNFNWEKYKDTLMTGLRHYLVRVTREGIKRRQTRNDLIEINFPKPKVEQICYSFDKKTSILDIINKFDEEEVFEGLNPENLNIKLASSITQRTAHPIDLFSEIFNYNGGTAKIMEKKFSKEILKNNIKLFNKGEKNNTLIPYIYSLINFIGFTPYKIETYNYKIYNKTIDQIREDNSYENISSRFQLSVHNMLHVTWLKRLESSIASLKMSVYNYMKRINEFKYYLDKGYLLSFKDIDTLINEHDGNMEMSFKSIQEDAEIKIEEKKADPAIYNIEQLKIDLKRDIAICKYLCSVLDKVLNNESDVKLNKLANHLIELSKNNKYGKKIIVFSFYSDTINYLRKNIPSIIGKEIKEFNERSEFISSGNMNEKVTSRFSPKSKNYNLRNGESELDFLFTTDVLSEGQNLQDAAILINYDLHWNPVRMIQRNGRINRLGSSFKEILIGNVRPDEDLELYLNLVEKLENKISIINNTVGNDQSILGEKENPIEFDSIYNINSKKASDYMESIENTKDILDWVDSYSLELRKYLDNADENDKNRVFNIPKGKWNYLPKNTNEHDDNEIIGLYKNQTAKQRKGHPTAEVGFVKIAPTKEYRGPFSSLITEYVNEQDALEVIKTDPSNNERKRDEILVDRAQYIEHGRIEAKVQFESSRESYYIATSALNALEYISKYYSDENIKKIIEKNIKTLDEKKSFEKVIRKINGELKKEGSINTKTFNQFNQFLINIKEKEINKDDNSKEVEGVLYYAKYK